jgi:hypothetical protein
MAWQKANYLAAEMTKPGKPTKRKPKPISPEIESLDLDPDAWEKFEKLVHNAAKTRLPNAKRRPTSQKP